MIHEKDERVKGGKKRMISVEMEDVLAVLQLCKPYIIGIIAALTVPIMVQNFKERVTVTKVKKAYSVIEQAYRMAIVENGSMDKWNIDHSDTNTGEVNEDGQTIIDYTGAEQAFAIITKYIKGTQLPIDWEKESTNMQGTEVSMDIFAPNERHASKAIQMADGVIFEMRFIKPNCTINSPNMVCADAGIYLPDKSDKMIQGKNYFYLAFAPAHVMYSYLNSDYITGFEKYCNPTVNNRESGRGCLAWIIEYGNMDYLRCDDLKWGEKTKCD